MVNTLESVLVRLRSFRSEVPRLVKTCISQAIFGRCFSDSHVVNQPDFGIRPKVLVSSSSGLESVGPPR